MLHGVVEQHQIHDSVDLVIRVQGLFKDLTEGLPGGDSQVLGLTYTTGKMAEDEWILLEGIIIHVLCNDLMQLCVLLNANIYYFNK